MQTKDTKVYVSSLVDKYSDMVYRTAYHALCDTHYAEDVTQEVFLKLCHTLPDFESEEHEKAWLLRVTINMCKNYNKRVYAHPSVELSETIPINDEYRSDGTVLSAVKALPEKYRTAIYLYYFEGYQIKEIAEIMKSNQNTVSSLLMRARNKLGSMLGGEFDDEA
ncbi:MAG: sigma-70 family RNA polymerase sigma factor [Oscillospiraceae bacterium]|nr:sigma-70 family RNA polymerase sigma factor [Oscillospiraceae bacterium]